MAFQLGCPLAGRWITCGNGTENHHIINFSKARKSPRVRALLKTNPPELTIRVCQKHNHSRWADSKEAQAILIYLKVIQFGWDHMDAYLKNLPWKVPRYRFTLRPMLSNLPDDFKVRLNIALKIAEIQAQP